MSDNLFDLSTQARAKSIGIGLIADSFLLPTSYLTDGANFIKKDGSITFTGAINLGGNKITGGAAGTAATDFITLSQLQAYVNGSSLHFPRFVATANISSLSGAQTVDGATPTTGDEILLTAQTTGSQNGPWIYNSSGAWTRPDYFASGNIEQEGQYFIVGPDGSSTNKNTKWYLTNTSAITVGTTAITLQQDLSGTSYINGSGLNLSGNTFSVKTGSGIQIDGTSAVAVLADPNRLLQAVAAGVGIKDGTAAQLLMANSSGNASYQTMSGDVTITAAGVTAVNHTAGSGFLKYTDMVTGEVPTPAVDGTTKIFNLAGTPQNGSLRLFRNGQRVLLGSGNTATISGSQITFATAPAATDNLQADYQK